MSLIPDQVKQATFRVDVESIDVTSDRESPDPKWTHTDKRGHHHYYEKGYPTLTFVVDEEHWCDGTEGIYNHDPHQVVDEGHFECNECSATIKPGVIPPFTPQFIPGLIRHSATVYGEADDTFDHEGIRYQRVSMNFHSESGMVSEYVGVGGTDE